MGIIRNSINVEGLAKEDDFLIEPHDYIKKIFKDEIITIPHNIAEAKIVHEINVKFSIFEERIVNTGTGKMVMLGGEKNYKISYLENSPDARSCKTNIKTPFFFHLNLPSHMVDVGPISGYILDAYFHLLDSRRIYSHIIYWIKVKKLSTVEEEGNIKILTDGIVLEGCLYDLSEEIL